MKTINTIAILSIIIIVCSTDLQSNNTEHTNITSLEKHTLEILTCNTGDLGGHKKISPPELAAFLKTCGNPDILFLQEIRGEAEAIMVAQELGMKHHLFLHYKKKRPGITIISKLPLLNRDHIYFKEGIRGYGALSAYIMLNNVRVLLVNVHLERNDHVQSKHGSVKFNLTSAWQFIQDEMWMDTLRTRSAHELIDWLKRKEAYNIILGGDFNTISISRSIRIIKTMFDDALCPSWFSFQGTYTRLNAPFPVRIDFLFHTPKLIPLEAKIIPNSPGDHYPVMARFKIP